MQRTLSAAEDLILFKRTAREELDKINLVIEHLQKFLISISGQFLKAPNILFGNMLYNDLYPRVFNRKLNAKREKTFAAVKEYLKGIYKEKFKFSDSEHEFLDIMINFYLEIDKTLNQLQEMKITGIYSGLSNDQLQEYLQKVKNLLPSYRFQNPWVELRKLEWNDPDLEFLKKLSDDRQKEKLRITAKVEEKSDREYEKQRQIRKNIDDEYIASLIDTVNARPRHSEPHPFLVKNPGNSGVLSDTANSQRSSSTWEGRLREIEQNEKRAERNRETRIEHEDRRPTPAAPPQKSSNLKKYLFTIALTALAGAVVGGGVGALAGFASLGVGMVFTVPAGVIAGFFAGLIAGSIGYCCFNSCCAKKEEPQMADEESPVVRRESDADEHRAAIPQVVPPISPETHVEVTEPTPVRERSHSAENDRRSNNFSRTGQSFIAQIGGNNIGSSLPPDKHPTGPTLSYSLS